MNDEFIEKVKRMIFEAAWECYFGEEDEVCDYGGRMIRKSDYGKKNSQYRPEFAYICPLEKGGKDVMENIVVCHADSIVEKADLFPGWKCNGHSFMARQSLVSEFGYDIYEER